MSTGGFIGADERGNVVLDISPLEDSHWVCQATKDFDVKRVHFKNVRHGDYLSCLSDGTWKLGPGPDEATTGFDLELLKTVRSQLGFGLGLELGLGLGSVRTSQDGALSRDVVRPWFTPSFVLTSHCFEFDRR